MRKQITHGIIASAVIVSFCSQQTRAQANTSLSNLAAPTSVNTHLLPDTDDTRDLGAGPQGWRSLYLTNSIYMRAQKFLSADIDYNTYIGIGAAGSITGSANVALGYGALGGTTGGNNSIAIGVNSLNSSLYSESNIAIGSYALNSNVYGYENLALGINAGSSNTNGTAITALGHYSLTNNQSDNATAVGYSALGSNTAGINNTALGYSALASNTTASNNTAVGHNALNMNVYGNVSGEENTAIGSTTLVSSVGSGNTAVGYSALANNSAADVTAVGRYAGVTSFYGAGNSFFGAYAQITPNNASNSTALGFQTYVTASDQVRLGNSSVTSIGGYAGWTNLSDGRFKKNLRENVPGLDFINKLRPVTYTIDLDKLDDALKPEAAAKIPQRKKSAEEIAAKAKKAQMIQTGFVAQEVEKAAQELGFDFSGVDAPKNSKDLYGLRYAEFVVPLVKAVQQLDEANRSLQQQNASLEERIRKLEELVIKNTDLKNTSVQLSGARLEQNAPNPFNGNTIIAYTVPDADGSGKIVISDMKGVSIKAINVNGKGQVTLNKGTLAAGEYVYSLWIGDRLVDTKKMSVK